MYIEEMNICMKTYKEEIKAQRQETKTKQKPNGYILLKGNVRINLYKKILKLTTNQDRKRKQKTNAYRSKKKKTLRKVRKTCTLITFSKRKQNA